MTDEFKQEWIESLESEIAAFKKRVIEGFESEQNILHLIVLEERLKVIKNIRCMHLTIDCFPPQPTPFWWLSTD